MTTTAIPSLDVGDFKENIQDFDRMANGTGTYADRFGKDRLTLDEFMRRNGYEVPVVFASGIAVSRVTQTVTYSGVTYHALATAIPFTTTGTFNAAQWEVISGVSRQELGAEYGGSLIGAATYAQLRAYNGDATRMPLVDGGVAIRRGTAADNGGTIWKDALNRSWEREFTGAADVTWFGAIGDGNIANASTNATAFHKACIYCWQTSTDLYIPAGDYKGGRVEIHGSFNVNATNAIVEYLGIGTTYIAGTGSGTSAAPTAWPNDPSYDAEGNFNPVMYTLAATIAKGDSSFQVASATGLAAGQYLFIGGNPSSASSANNYIPIDFEFVLIDSVVGTTVNIQGKFKNAYSAIGTGAGAAAAFYSAGLAFNCEVSPGLRVNTGTDAYQYVVRSAFNVHIKQPEFLGDSACGASTFTENFRISLGKSHNANGPISCARGTVSAYIDGAEYGENLGGPTGLFIEESFYRIDVRNMQARNSALSIRAVDMGTPSVKRLLTVDGSVFDTSSINESPFQCGTATGFDFIASKSTFVGKVVTPNSAVYPGITGTAMMWVTSTLAGDTWKFTACQFKGDAGAVFKAGSGVQGKILFDELCTYETVSAPDTKYTPRGAWKPITLAGAFTAISGYTAPTYRIQDKTVHLTGSVQVNSETSGNTCFTLPAEARPIASKLLPSGALTGAAAAGYGLLSVDSAGVVSARWSSGVAYFGLDGISFPLDA